MFENKFLAVIDRDGYVFSREVRCNGIIISLLPFRKKSRSLEFLTRVEVCPAHSPSLEQCSITGGLEPGSSIEDTALQELWEEAGYQAASEELIPLGAVRPSKSADTTVHLFAIDVGQKQQTPPLGDGTDLEDNALVEWVNYKQGIQNKDPLFVTMITRLLNLLEEKSDGITGN